MGLPDLYPAQVGSPYTTLAAPYTSGESTMTLVDATKLPDAPNIVCLAGDVAGEFKYTGKDGNTLTGVTKLSGTPETTWLAGTYAFRGIAAYDHNALIANVVSKEPAFAKNSAFNKNFGTTSGTVCQGNDPRLSDARTPKAHTHGGGDITSTVANAATATKLATARKITLSGDVTGSTTFDGSGDKTIITVVADNSHNHVIENVDGLQDALDGMVVVGHNHDDLYEPAFVKRTAFNKDFGTTKGTVCEGNDSRLSDPRPPTAHTHDGTDITSAVANATTAAACSGNAATATKLKTARTISLTGDVTGSASFDGSANVAITTVVADNSHNHIIENVVGLQEALDGCSGGEHNHDGLYEPAFDKRTAFNKDFGTTAGTVCQGNDPRLSDSRDPKPHTHGGTDITGTVANADKVDGYHAADLPAYVQGQNLPTRTLVLQGASLIVPDTNGAEIVTETLPGGRLIRGASFGVSASDITAQIGHPMPTNWDGGTVTAQFLFATAATAGTVKFSLAGRASVSDNELDQAFGTPQSATLDIAAQPGKAAWDLWTTDPTNPITLAGSPQGPGRRWIQWKITRDAADTCAYDVLLLAVVIEYGTDRYGDA